MPIKILMPALSPTMTHGNLSKWHKKEGDKVKPGEVIAEIETDKATMEVEAVDAGIIGKILVADGTSEVAVNSLIAILLEEGEDNKNLDEFIASAASPATVQKVEESNSPVAVSSTTESVSNNNSERIFASPLAKRIAEQNSVNLSNVQGSGPHGRIIKDDVINVKPQSQNLIATPSVGRNSEESIKLPISTMRKVIASRLLESKQTIPHFYLSIECVMDNLMNARSEMNNQTSKENPAYKLSVNDFIIKAVAMALRAVPEVNSSWGGDCLIKYNNVDVAIAVAIEGGLITPIIRNADQKSLSTLSNEMKSLAKRAKSGGLKPEEFQGGGFSISNLGMFGIKNFQAIVNPPQSAILAVGATSARPIVKNGQIVSAEVMDLSLSCDHRVVDGAVAANFLSELKKFIENPVLMLV